MYEIVQNEFSNMCDEYLLSEEEAQKVAENLSKKLDEDMFKDMYQSKEPQEFIRNVLDPLFTEAVSDRENIELPSEEEMREALLYDMEGLVFIH